MTDAYYYYVIVLDVLQQKLYQERYSLKMQQAVMEHISYQTYMYNLMTATKRTCPVLTRWPFLRRLTEGIYQGTPNYVNYISDPQQLFSKMYEGKNEYRINSVNNCYNYVCQNFKGKIPGGIGHSLCRNDGIRYETYCHLNQTEFDNLSNSTKIENEYLAELVEDYWYEIVAQECDDIEMTCKFFSSDVIKDFTNYTPDIQNWLALGENARKILDAVNWKTVLLTFAPQPAGIPSPTTSIIQYLYQYEIYQTDDDYGQILQDKFIQNVEYFGKTSDILQSGFWPLMFGWKMQFWFIDMMNKALFINHVGNLRHMSVFDPAKFYKIYKSNLFMSQGVPVNSTFIENWNLEFKIGDLKYQFPGFVPFNLAPENNIMFLDMDGETLDIKKYVIRNDSPISSTCLKINATLLQKTSGSANGLRMVMFLGNKKFAQFAPRFNYRDRAYNLVSFDLPGSQWSNGNPEVASPVTIKSGQLTQIGLQKQKYNRILQPKGSCENDQTTQSIAECENHCFIQTVYDHPESPCQCFLPFAAQTHANYTHEQECSFANLTETNCFNFLMQFKKDPKRYCECKIPCEEPFYASTVTVTDNNLIADFEWLKFSQDYDYIFEGQGAWDEIPANETDDYASVMRRYQNWMADVAGNYDIGVTNLLHKFRAAGMTNLLPSIQNTTDRFELYLNESPIRYYKDFMTRMAQVSAFNSDENHLKATTSAAELNSGISIVDIYYEKLRIQRINENDDDVFISLFSDIGGQLGLWLGVSIVSMMELVHFLVFSVFGNYANGIFKFVRSRFRRIFRKRNQKRKTTPRVGSRNLNAHLEAVSASQIKNKWVEDVQHV